MRTLKLAAIDLDGTLLDDDKQLSPRNADALERLLTRGVAVALVSARDWASVRMKVPLTLPGLYYLGSGGALIVEAVSGAMVWSSYLSAAQMTECVQVLKAHDHPIFLNSENDYWVDRRNARVRMIETRYNLSTRPFRDVAEVCWPVMRVSLAAPVVVLRRAVSQARARLGHWINVSLASPDWLDLLPLGAGKGPALKVLQAHLGIARAQTAAIGDFDCDLALFERAAHRVAVGNAVPAVKAAATLITASNNDDGVAQALQALS